MSNHLISTAYKRDLGTGTRKAVMVYLADKASDDGRGIYASKQTMADELNLSKKTMIDVIKGLLDDDLLIQIGERRCANGYTVEYAIDVSRLEGLALVGCHQRRAERAPRGATGSPVNEVHRCGKFTGTGEAASPEPLLEPNTPLPPIADVSEQTDQDRNDDARQYRRPTPHETNAMLRKMENGQQSARNRSGRTRAGRNVAPAPASIQLAQCEEHAARYRRLGNESQARYWERRASELRSGVQSEACG